ncbi:MAG: 4Fe-4S dicluster domain-containing protein [Candidatus Bathyarchaeia archaeon]|jgi:ferredoxin
MAEKKSADIDIFNLLSETSAQKSVKKSPRQELLEPTGVKDLFKEGKISINKYTCVGVQCKLCIKACPTNALYWKTGEVGVIEDLCVYCGACVLSCMVDDCIKITRQRENGKTESFSKTRDVVVLANCLNSERRHQRVREVFPSADDYSKKYCRLKE